MTRLWLYILFAVLWPSLALATPPPSPVTGGVETGRLRYHVHGSQYIDERVATYNDATGQLTYYLLKDNFSVVGTGNASGTSLARLGYSALGDSAGSAYSPADFDTDGDVDLADYAVFAGHVNGPNQPGQGTNWQRADLDSDNDVDLKDFLIFHTCFGSSGTAAPPSSGSFALHGLPVDVLPDGHVLLYVRARYYDPKNGRWLQRDPIGYVDGANLYEAFGGNAATNTDPQGTEIWVTTRQYKGIQDGRPVLAVDYYVNRNGLDTGYLGWLRGKETREYFGTEVFPDTADPWTLYLYGNAIETKRRACEAYSYHMRDDEIRKRLQITSVTIAVAAPVAGVVGGPAQAAFSTTNVGITTTTTLGNVAAGSLTGAVSLGTGSTVAVGLVTGDPEAAAQAGMEGFVFGAAGGALFGTAVPTGPASAVTAEATIAARRAPVRGVLENANFAQRTFARTFSSEGAFAGRTVENVAGALRSGAMKPSAVPVQYVIRDGQTLILNTRSAQALEQAGIPRAQWNAVNMTGNAAAEARLTRQLLNNNLTNQGTPTVRPSGGR